LAKGSLEARELIVKAFERYFKEGGPEEGSALIKARYDHSVEYNISVNDIARFEIGGAVANVANTGPAAFWVVYHMFSDSAVLEDTRREVSQLVKVGPNGCTIDISKVKTSCPTLVSTFQEVLRFHSIGTSVRVIMDDHLLDGKYLLKKGNTVMIPGAVQHSSTSIWGENVAQFDHKRFVRSGGIKGPNPVAVRGFGGGTTLCPGRHFASTQVLGFAALMALRFDVAPVAGRWIRPTTEKAEMWTTVPQPDFDIEAAVTSREGGNMNGKLNVIFAGSDKVMELSAEDIGTART
jgi:cytochrome P450